MHGKHVTHAHAYHKTTPCMERKGKCCPVPLSFFLFPFLTIFFSFSSPVQLMPFLGEKFLKWKFCFLHGDWGKVREVGKPACQKVESYVLWRERRGRGRERAKKEGKGKGMEGDRERKEVKSAKCMQKVLCSSLPKSQLIKCQN